MNKVSKLVLSLICLLGCSIADAKMICVSQVQAHLREAPSKRSALLRTIFENTPLQQISKRDRWIKVRDYAGKNYYIFDSLVSSKRDCLIILGGTRTFSAPDALSPTHKTRALVHHLEGLQVIKKDLGFTEVLDRFDNKFWIDSSARFWPTRL